MVWFHMNFLPGARIRFGALGVWVWKLRFKIWDSRYKDLRLGLGVWILGFGVWGLGFRVWGLGIRTGCGALVGV